jgi:hypothetical protein
LNFSSAIVFTSCDESAAGARGMIPHRPGTAINIAIDTLLLTAGAFIPEILQRYLYRNTMFTEFPVFGFFPIIMLW